MNLLFEYVVGITELAAEKEVDPTEQRLRIVSEVLGLLRKAVERSETSACADEDTLLSRGLRLSCSLLAGKRSSLAPPSSV